MSTTTEESLHPGLNLGEEHGEDHLEAETSVFGFWVFMMSDLVTFGMFFAVFASSTTALAGGPGPKELFDLGSVAWQTAFLLLSSLTSGMAVLCLKQEHADRVFPRKQLVFWLLLTVLLGCGFLYREVSDFIDMAAKGGPPTRSGYLSSLWSLVGLHGVHVTSGILWCLVIVAGILAQGVNQAWKLTILRWAVFWHFLDIVWIAIFSFVFLGGLL
ncbi:cytochrome c oxidase subunit 3 [Puniceicoccus vermicola]|uniref:Cytochrome bo(3) ubiquinol oxidase subunit 3 n=1 Tax=Puniceicoccus vermicola TaxID=388746 RepID=A0A7X1AXV4_9BACT|nr:cytochrome c oxidase subunit 3 [Puniceicoccus vermicola]MBC2601966.1 cytochrome c oxidase subunit 3 [Puniceicoccus vermicola]